MSHANLFEDVNSEVAVYLYEVAKHLQLPLSALRYRQDSTMSLRGGFRSSFV